MSEKMTAEDRSVLLKEPQLNIDGHQSNLFLVWDAGIDEMFKHTLERHNYAYINPEKKIGDSWKQRLAEMHERVNAVKDKIASSQEKGDDTLPTRKEFREANVALHKWFNSKDSVGEFYRGVIDKTLAALSMKPIARGAIRDA